MAVSLVPMTKPPLIGGGVSCSGRPICPFVICTVLVTFPGSKVTRGKNRSLALNILVPIFYSH